LVITYFFGGGTNYKRGDHKVGYIYCQGLWNLVQCWVVIATSCYAQGQQSEVLNCRWSNIFLMSCKKERINLCYLHFLLVIYSLHYIWFVDASHYIWHFCFSCEFHWWCTSWKPWLRQGLWVGLSSSKKPHYKETWIFYQKNWLKKNKSWHMSIWLIKILDKSILTCSSWLLVFKPMVFLLVFCWLY
jgi:hypothetical protein